MARQHLKQRSDGRYACRAEGHWFYGETEKEALAKRAEYYRMREKGMKEEAYGMSVEKYAARWVKVYKNDLTSGPYNTHVRMLNRFCLHEGIGARTIRSITAIDIKSFYNTAEGMSESYIHDMRDSIRGLFKGALADRLIETDPTLGIDLPKGTKGTHRAISEEERELIHSTDHKMRLAAMIMLYAGLRRGEVLALRIDRDVDFFEKTISVQEAVRYEFQHIPSIVPTKTDAGTRTVPMANILSDELRGLSGLVLTKETGDLASASAWRSAWNSYMVALSEKKNGCRKRWYGRTKKHKAMIAKYEELMAQGRDIEAQKYKLPEWEDVVIRSHDLRHTYCTMLYEAGVDIKTAQKWMGHADDEMVRKIYTHLSEKMEKKSEKAFEKYEKFLFGSQIGSQ